MVPLPLSVTVAALLAAAQPPSPEPWELLKYAPPQANSVLTINVHRLMASQRAEKDGWAKLDHTAYLAGAVPISPTVERIVVAKALEPAAPGHGAAVAILPTRSALDLAALGQKLGGTPVTIGGEPAMQMPNGGLLVPLANTVLGAAWGKSKPQLAAWARGARAADKSPLSRLLTSTVADTAGRNHRVSFVQPVWTVRGWRLWRWRWLGRYRRFRRQPRSVRWCLDCDVGRAVVARAHSGHAAHQLGWRRWSRRQRWTWWQRRKWRCGWSGRLQRRQLRRSRRQRRSRWHRRLGRSGWRRRWRFGDWPVVRRGFVARSQRHFVHCRHSGRRRARRFVRHHWKQRQPGPVARECWLPLATRASCRPTRARRGRQP